MRNPAYSLDREIEDEITGRADLLGIVSRNDKPILEGVRKITKPRTVFPHDDAVKVGKQIRGKLITEDYAGFFPFCHDETLANFVYEQGEFVDDIESGYDVCRIEYRDNDGKKKRVSFLTYEFGSDASNSRVVEEKSLFGWKRIPQKEAPHAGYTPCSSA